MEYCYSGSAEESRRFLRVLVRDVSTPREPLETFQSPLSDPPAAIPLAA
jgi:hypothetical protein